VFKVATRSPRSEQLRQGACERVFNGTLGVVTGLDRPSRSSPSATDEDEDIEYEFGELDELTHAYA